MRRISLPTTLAVTACVLGLSSLPGCIFTSDFDETPEATDTGQLSDTSQADGAADASSDVAAPQDTGSAPDTAGASDASSGSDATGGSDTASADASTKPDFAEMGGSTEYCLSTVTVWQVAPSDFGTAGHALWASTRATKMAIGPPPHKGVSTRKAANTIVVASTYENTEAATQGIAIAWTTIDSADMDDSTVAVDTAPTRMTYDVNVDLTGGSGVDGMLEIYDVVSMPPRSGASGSNRYETYSTLVLTNAGVIECKVSAAEKNGGLDDFQHECTPSTGLNNLLDDQGVYPARRLEWMPVKGVAGFWHQILLIEGGPVDAPKLALFDINWLQLKFEALPLEVVQQHLTDPDLHFAQELVLGWADYANTNPVLLMLDHGQQPPAAAELFSSADNSTYLHASGPGDMPLPDGINLGPDTFSFTWRLFGGTNDASHTTGFVAADTDGDRLIFGEADTFDQATWLTLDTPDLAAVWAFENGGPALLAYSRGDSRDTLGLASWSLDSELIRIPEVVDPGAHNLSRIRQVGASSEWLGTLNYTNANDVPGKLAFAANNTDGQTSIYLLNLPNIRDASTVCDPPN